MYIELWGWNESAKLWYTTAVLSVKWNGWYLINLFSGVRGSVAAVA